jgi:O-antigen/teichoic acid export membrane protein
MDSVTVHKKIIHGFLTLTFRRVLLLLITFFVTNVWLARILSPEIIGVFNIGTSILAFFTYFSDVGRYCRASHFITEAFCFQ